MENGGDRMEEKNSYAEDMKGTFQGIAILLILGLIIWAFTSLTGIGNSEDTYTPPRQPTAEQEKQWTKEYNEYGNNDPDIDVSQQYGGLLDPITSQNGVAIHLNQG